MASETPAPDVHPLRAARLQQGLLLKDVAAVAGCAVSLVSMCEKGYQPGASVAERIGRAVGASGAAFWPGLRS